MNCLFVRLATLDLRFEGEGCLGPIPNIYVLVRALPIENSFIFISWDYRIPVNVRGGSSHVVEDYISEFVALGW